MTKSTTSFLFPDINVWLALSHQSHVHHRLASAWFESLSDSTRLCFCRMTQVGLLRLLTTEQVMNPGDPFTQHQAWRLYDGLLEDDRIVFVNEPDTLERSFRDSSQMRRAAPKDWADSYLIAFAQAAGFQLVTFDRAIRNKFSGSLYLGPT